MTADTLLVAATTLASALFGAVVGGWFANRAASVALEGAIEAERIERQIEHDREKRLALQATALELRIGARLVDIEHPACILPTVALERAMPFFNLTDEVVLASVYEATDLLIEWNMRAKRLNDWLSVPYVETIRTVSTGYDPIERRSPPPKNPVSTT